VALIVRLDDMGLYLIRKSGGRGVGAALGRAMVSALPRIVKSLSIVGTLAMLLVAGGIFLHHIPRLHELFHSWPSLAAELLIGLIIGLMMAGVAALLRPVFWAGKF
jgi:predicted DNA repair protein MutK